MKSLLLIAFFSVNFLFLFGQKKEDASLSKIENRILDHANLLTSKQKESIFKLIQDLEKKTGSQIAIVTIESLNGETINNFSLGLANRMGLGRKKYKDGLLIAFAVKEGQLRTEVGVGLNQIITDEFAAIVNQGIIVPQFSAGNYANGFYNGVKAFKEKIETNPNLIGPKKK